ncbi:MAG: DoxX family membrane protein [Bacteroidales bacterium]|nr:DoxX family membrane protein [Bacteroidales bacterium]
MKSIRIFSRIFVGLVFLFSGFVKAVDPLGTAYKFFDYFEAFHLAFLNPLTLVLSVLLSSAELIIGINLLLGLRMKVTSWALMVFMGVFTLITLKLAISNPVTDCGCFGDAIILTNWQTFWKNVIILVPTVLIFFQRDRFLPFYGTGKEWVLVAVFTFTFVAFSVYNYNNLPLLDFRPYNIGADIPAKMTIPEGSPKDEYEFVFIYEKNGRQQEFSLDNLPDSTWNMVDRKEKLISKGYVPPVHDFSITTLDGDDITQDVLDDVNYTFLIVAYDLQKANKESLTGLSAMAEKYTNDNMRFICLTSSTFEVIEGFIAENKPAFEICTADNITLKTIVRANPGLVLLKKGVIIGKWHFRNIPYECEGDLLAFSLNEQRISRSRMSVVISALGIMIIALVFHLLNKEGKRKTSR